MANLDLLIINPSAAHGIKGGHPIYADLGDKLIAVEPPQWARIIAGHAIDRGYTVKIIDAEAQRIEPEKVAELAGNFDPTLTCLAVYGHMPSASTQQMHGAREVAQALRDAGVSPVIMVGGHPSALPERTLREELVNYVCKGEGPTTIVDLLEVLLDGDGNGDLGAVPGLVWYPNKDVVRINNPAPLLDIDELHGDAWELLPMDKYRAHNWQCFSDLGKRQPYASIFTSLSCPYACHFCCIHAPFGGSQTVTGRTYRTRSPESVVREIKMLYEAYHVRTFKITDEMFVLAPKHYTAIAEGLIDEGLGDKINVWCYGRADTIQPDKLNLLRRAGVRWIALGIESGSKYVMDGTNKRLKAHDIADVVDAIQRAGINVIGNFIVGLYDDSEETMRETLDLAKSLRLDFMNIYSAMAYPGSPLYDEAVKKGWALPATNAGYSQHNKWSRPLDTQYISGAKVLAFRDSAFNEFFTDEAYLARMAQKFGRETETHLRGMTRYKLDRLLLHEGYPREQLETRCAGETA